MPTSPAETPRRIIARVELRAGRLAQPARERGLRDDSDPIEFARQLQSEGVDEILFLDASEDYEGQARLVNVIDTASQSLFVPVLAGGGIGTLDKVDALIGAGAAKVVFDDAAVVDPDMLAHASQRYGAARLVLAIDVREERRQVEIEARPEVDATHSAGPPPEHTWFRVFTHRGADATPLDAVTWARRGVEQGAGEIMITSIDRTGTGRGFDLELAARLDEAVEVPVIAGGGAGSAEHLRDLFLLAGAGGALIGRMFQEGAPTAREIKQVLAAAGVPVNPAPAHVMP